MSQKLFISYSRKNQYIAERLHLDLRRAGCEVWWDQRSIPLGDLWMKRIKEGISNADQFLYMWSPEAKESKYVQEERELATQLGKPVKVIRVAGNIGDMEDNLDKTQVINLAQDYWSKLPGLLEELGVSKSRIPSAKELIQSQNLTTREVRKQIGDASPREWTIIPRAADGPAMLTFQRIPLIPKGYATSWWIAEENATISLRGKAYVALDFSGDRSDNIVRDVLQFLVDQNPAPDSLPQLLHLEGPLNNHEQAGQDRPVYLLPNDKPNVWRDCIDLAVTAIKEFGDKREMHIFMDAPVALVFPIAAKLREFTPYHIYNLNRSGVEQRYSLVYSYEM